MSYLKPKYISSEETNKRIAAEIETFKSLAKKMNQKNGFVDLVLLLNFSAWFAGMANTTFTLVSELALQYIGRPLMTVEENELYTRQLDKLVNIYKLCAKGQSEELTHNQTFCDLVEAIAPNIELYELKSAWSKPLNKDNVSERFREIIDRPPHKNGFFGLDEKAQEVDISLYGMATKTWADFHLYRYGHHKTENSQNKMIMETVNQLRKSVMS